MAFLGLRKWSTPVLRPMAPFLAASVVTFYLVSKMQEMGVRCTLYAFSTLTLHEWVLQRETYAKDPKNPYGAQIAKEAHH
ncbi:hypothetical protein BDR07DRAFT_1098122 [Suillus spraguei]|nr:hypothetical protein BDR07DRAFT_1098122 [Suillus spraguei]